MVALAHATFKETAMPQRNQGMSMSFSDDNILLNKEQRKDYD